MSENEPPRLSLLTLLAQLGELDLSNGKTVLLPSDGTSLLPYSDGGNPVALVDGKLSAEIYTHNVSDSVMTEYMVMRDTSTSTRATYPDHSPRLPGASPSDTVMSASASPFNSVSSFLAGARGNLSLASSEDATYARAAARRFRVTNVSALAGSLSEVTPASKKITRLEGKDAYNNDVEGWVYVEKATTVDDDTVQCQVHQLVPSSMVLPPTGNVTLKAYSNPSNWDLPGWVSANASNGMQYCRGVCWISVVNTTSELQNAPIPSGPSTPSGVEDWD